MIVKTNAMLFPHISLKRVGITPILRAIFRQRFFLDYITNPVACIRFHKLQETTRNRANLTALGLIKTCRHAIAFGKWS